MIFHADGNSFYASCERIFRPDLKNAPIAVLSNNDGIVIAANRECEALGFKRGSAFFKIRHQLEAAKVAVFSSNYTLYADISARINSVYSRYAEDVEMYSIDESFLFFPDWTNVDYKEIARAVKTAVEKEIGVPVSIGIAPTKTLAKLCNKLAKGPRGTGQGLQPCEGIFDWAACDQEETLKGFPAGGVWGIGRAKKFFLRKYSVFTALDVKNFPLDKAKKYLSVTGFNTVRELNGIRCIDRVSVKPRQSVMCSQSFSKVVYDIDQIITALSDFTQEAVKRLRDEKLMCRYVTVFLVAVKARNGQGEVHGRRNYKTSSGELERATSYLPDILGRAVELLRTMYRGDEGYRKVLVLLAGLERENRAQPELFDNDEGREQKRRAMSTFDQINRRYGRKTLHIASSDLVKDGKEKSKWRMKREMMSPAYTTKLSDVPVVK
jgi:DNA polymerase V